MSQTKEKTPISLRKCIQKVATGPEFSKDISFEDAYAAMQTILLEECDPVEAAVYLVGLRMKRETLDECGGTLKAICDTIPSVTADVEHLVDIGDMYNGYARSIPMTPFVPAVMASLGVGSVIHGVETVGPKFGLTSHKVYKKLGIKTDLSPEAVGKQIEDKNIGWGYIDQQVFCPNLYKLISLRTKIVKRPVLTTVEVLNNPIRGRKTHLITGYVHKAYPPIYAHLAQIAGFDSAAIVRGVEGGCIPSLKQAANLFEYFDDKVLNKRELDPLSIGFEHTTRSIPIPETMSRELAIDEIAAEVDTDKMADYCIEQGLEALHGKQNIAYDMLVYAAAFILTHLKMEDSLEAAADTVRDKINSGESLAHLSALRL